MGYPPIAPAFVACPLVIPANNRPCPGPARPFLTQPARVAAVPQVFELLGEPGDAAPYGDLVECMGSDPMSASGRRGRCCVRYGL